MKLYWYYLVVATSMAGSTSSKMASASSLERELAKSNKGGKKGGRHGRAEVKGLKRRVHELEDEIANLTNKLMSRSKTIIDFDAQLYGDEYCTHLTNTRGPVESCNSVCPLVLRASHDAVSSGILPPIIGNCVLTNEGSVCVPACTRDDGTMCQGEVEYTHAVAIAKRDYCDSAPTQSPTPFCVPEGVCCGYTTLDLDCYDVNIFPCCQGLACRKQVRGVYQCSE